MKTTALERDGTYFLNGSKTFITNGAEADTVVVFATHDTSKGYKGVSAFVVPRSSPGFQVNPLHGKMGMRGSSTCELVFQDTPVPMESRLGEEGMGFRYIIDSWNVERILVASESIGDGDWFIDKATEYAKSREVFGRPIGANQGVQFPISQAYAHIRGADLMRYDAAAKYDREERCGAEANMAKLLASEASWEAANVCMDVHGGYGFAQEYDVERKFRESRLYITAPVNNNLVLAFLGQNVLGMPRSY